MQFLEHKPTVVIVVVARMGSTRVPGKALIDICGRPAISHVLQIAKNIGGADAVCLATSDQAQDDPLAEFARREEIYCYRGEAEQVLDRLYSAAKAMNAEVIIEIGGDCPLLDPALVSDALKVFFASAADYVSNYDPPTFPEGMDINIISFAALEMIWKRAIAPSQRIHPFSYITFHPDEFLSDTFQMSPDLSNHHWSLDFPEDVELIQMAYERLWRGNCPIRLADLTTLLDIDEEFARKDMKLKRPVVLHAYWNSPRMIMDMNNDIATLAERAYEHFQNGKNVEAGKCYREVIKIAECLRGAALPDGKVRTK